MTRNPDSPSAQKLASKSANVKLVKGDLADPGPLFDRARQLTSQPVWGVFSVQTALGKGASVEGEEQQGRALVAESIKQGVSHFVQSTVDRGGDERSYDNETDVPHFASKYRLEHYLLDEVAKAGGKMTWTLLRPVAFYDNFAPGFPARVFVTALKNHLGDKPLQFVATKDIGVFGAKALLEADSPTYKNKAISLAGDSVSVDQIVEGFNAVSSSAPAPTFSILGSALTWGVAEMGHMIRWFAREGYGADIDKCKKLHPGMMDLRTWVAQSNWPKK